MPPTGPTSRPAYSLDVTLSDHGMELSGTEGYQAVTVHIKNDGASPHQLVVLRTDLDPAKLPLAGDTVDLAAAGEVVGTTGSLAPGDERSVETEQGITALLYAGSYVLLSNLPGDYQNGLFAGFTVTPR